jgi:hypothetical protein
MSGHDVFQYGRLPTEIVSSGVLASIATKPAAMLTYLSYVAFADAKMEAWPSEAFISEKCGIAADSVRRARRALEDAGLIVDTGHRRHRCKVYLVVTKPRSDTGSKPRNGAGCEADVTPQRGRRNPARRTPKPRSGAGQSERSEQIRSQAAPAAGAGAQPKGRGRRRDEIWDAVAFAFRLNPVTKADQSRVGRIVRDLKAKGATPGEIQTRLDRYRATWPNAADTPEALLKHWDRFGTSNGHGWQGGGDKTPSEVLDAICPLVEPPDEVFSQ